MTKLSVEQLEALVAVGGKIAPSTNWDYSLGMLKDALKEHLPGILAALWWASPESVVALTPGSAEAFDSFTSSQSIEDCVAEPEFQPISQLPGCFRIGLQSNRQTYGLLLLGGGEPELLGGLAKILATPIGLMAHCVKLEEEVNKRTSSDKLTGLWNRVYFNERFREECERLMRSKETGSVAIVGLDNLTALVRTMTPEDANNLLAQVGSVVRQVVRQTDWAVRWDGHDLLFYFPSTSAEAAVEVLKRFSKRLQTVSQVLEPLAGVSSTAETTSPRALVQLATRRLDLARKDGHRRVICYATPSGGMQFHREA
ncbi:MAG: GGDEF domain-containing protein [Cyanobacteria bacterium REEB65]|nr:GGDEF domain-containing protein [Cyanobacteria bacterium REEB65]